MLIGAHVSTAGGLVQAHARGVERGCEAIQVFNQSPRMWRPTRWKDEDIAEFLELMDGGPIRSVLIHAVYLINTASEDKDLRAKSIASLVHALRMGDAIGADGVVVHPGSALKGAKDKALVRAGRAVKEALAESDGCTLLLEDTAGSGATLGRSFDELAELIDVAGGKGRLGICLDSCHLLASGYDVRTADHLERVVDECDEKVGLDRLKCLHVNDSKTKLGSNADRHAPLGTGELGARGCAAFLSEPRFENLPSLFEGPGFAGHGPEKEDIQRMRELRRNGLRSRKRRAGR
jgi:deoxyribonuclease IV